VPLKATQVSFLLHVFPLFCSPSLPLVLFCHPHGAAQFSSLVRDVVAAALLLLFFWQFKEKIKRNCQQTPAATSSEFQQRQ
jgi:hypothetical protein